MFQKLKRSCLVLKDRSSRLHHLVKLECRCNKPMFFSKRESRRCIKCRSRETRSICSVLTVWSKRMTKTNFTLVTESRLKLMCSWTRKRLRDKWCAGGPSANCPCKPLSWRSRKGRRVGTSRNWIGMWTTRACQSRPLIQFKLFMIRDPVRILWSWTRFRVSTTIWVEMSWFLTTSREEASRLRPLEKSACKFR